ncbi:hypothetical protein [Methanobrevibacter sp.]
MADKTINLKVVADGEYSDIETLETKIRALKNERLNFRINADTAKIHSINEEIERAKREIQSLSATPFDAKVNMNEINQLISKIDKLEAEKIDLQVDVETAELEQVRDSIQDLENEEVEVQLRNQSAMEAISQIADGFSRLKQGASGVGQAMGGLLESAGKQETNKTFLAHALNNDVALAEEKMGEINKIVQDLPGDDTAVQGLLSQAIAKDASLAQDTLKDIGVAYADYASAMSFYGKSGVEAQQDMTNYILAGNTAELELSPILSSHIDKLKEATTVQERAKALQEALNEEHWGGMSQQDTFNNKLETFNGMLERGRYNLGGMFQAGAKSGMQFLMDLDQATWGLVGMTIAMGEMASPMFDMAMGFGQIATGLNSMKSLGMIAHLSKLGTALKSTAVAQWLLNIAMDANPITIIIIAIIALIAILGYLYFNNEQVRNAINGLGQTFIYIGQIIYTYLLQAFNTITTTLQGLWTYITTLGGLLPEQVNLTGNNIIDGILAVMAFIGTLPMQLAMIFINIIAQALGFGNNFAQTMINGAIRAVTGFIGRIQSGVAQFASAVQGIPNALKACLDWAYNLVMSHPIVQAVIWLGNRISEVFSSIGLGQSSPGKIYKALKNELNWSSELIRKDNTLITDASNLGSYISSNFNPSFDIPSNRELITTRSNINTNNNQVTGNGEITINIYGDVDNEERTKRIVEAVRRELSWNNKTAGRTL